VVASAPSPGLEVPVLERIKQFQLTDAFFSSAALRNRALGGPQPRLPRGNTASERRGRRFFEDVPPDPTDGLKPGLCAHCHSGTLMNQTNEFAPLFFGGLPVRTGTRFQDVLVSFFNQANNPVKEFIFTQAAGPDVHLFSPDPGRALITGIVDSPTTFENINAFKISQLRGIRRTAPYFHDNSAKTLEDVAAHYTRFFLFVSQGFIVLTPQDEADMVAFMKLLD
jgi:cytochrome c peroxidase